VGFETTAPLIAAAVKRVYEKGPENLLFHTSLKRMEPVLRYILNDKRRKINGIICPGHVAAIQGSDYFRFITDEYKMPAVICGFETTDIADGIYMLFEQIIGNRPVELINQYKRCVRPEGNIIARNLLDEVFDIADANWRGIGLIKNSAFILNKKFEHLDAAKRFNLNDKKSIYLNLPDSRCQCSDIILGIKEPRQCGMFGIECNPDNPLGPCMVSSEGACAVHYKYTGII
jgi:hydrogenase expression/formation protein HypD